MSDRTEEAKALRGWMNVYSITLAGLEKVTKEMRHGDSMLANIAGCKRALFKILVKYGVVDIAGNYGDGIKWNRKSPISTQLYPASVYRIKPCYELPDLTEVTPPRYANGTWIVSTRFGDLYEIVDRELWTQGDKNMSMCADDWFAMRTVSGHITWCQADAYQELPPMPDTNKLAAQGYRLTMRAADCSRKDHGHLYANAYCPADVLNYSTNDSGWHGWRWLVEKIEQESEEVLNLHVGIDDDSCLSIGYLTEEGIRLSVPTGLGRGRGTWSLTFKAEGVE